MKYPFRMYGNIIQIYRYQSVYTRKKTVENNGEFIKVEVEITQGFPTETEAQRTGGVVTALDTTQYEWLDGIEVVDVPDTYAEAIKIYEMGEESYLAWLSQPTTEERLTNLEGSMTTYDEMAIAYMEGVQKA